MREPFKRTPDMLVVRLPRRVKDDVRGRKRGRVRRRLVIRFYRGLAAKYHAWEARMLGGGAS